MEQGREALTREVLLLGAAPGAAGWARDGGRRCPGPRGCAGHGGQGKVRL